MSVTRPKWSAVCECGRPRRRRPNGTVFETCDECARLDGSDLPPSARDLISALRVVVHADWRDLLSELGCTRRQIYRALRLLMSRGRVRRVVTYELSAGRNRQGPIRISKPVVTFELTEEKHR